MPRKSTDMALEEGLYLFHHIFLPPKLPQEDDYNPKYDNVLLDKVIEALRNFSCYFTSQDASILDTATRAVSRLRDIAGHHGDVNEEELKKAIEQLCGEGIHVHQ